MAKLECCKCHKGMDEKRTFFRPVDPQGTKNRRWICNICDKRPIPTEKYKHFNHHHELDDEHEIVNIGGEEFIANKPAIPLLTALNDAGLKTRSHHIGNEDFAWVCLLMDNIESIEIREVFERNATRTKYNGKMEVCISWKKKINGGT